MHSSLLSYSLSANSPQKAVRVNSSRVKHFRPKRNCQTAIEADMSHRERRCRDEYVSNVTAGSRSQYEFSLFLRSRIASNISQSRSSNMRPMRDAANDLRMLIDLDAAPGFGSAVHISYTGRLNEYGPIGRLALLSLHVSRLVALARTWSL